VANVTGSIRIKSAMRQRLASVPPGASGVTSSSVPIDLKFDVRTSGTDDDQADLKYTKTLSFAAAAQVLNLQSLTDVQGNAVVLARVKSIIGKFRGAVEGNTLKLGYAALTSNAWTSLVSNPGQITFEAYSTDANDAGFAILAPGDGYDVGASNRLLNLDPGAATFSLDLEIVGASV